MAATGNSQSNGTAHAAPNNYGVAHQRSQAGCNGGDVDPAMKIYEGKLEEAQVEARAIARLYAVSRYLTYFTFTCATVIVLGGYLPNLLARDIAFATSLILVEAGRLASASFFTRLLKRPLAYASQDPKHIHHSRDNHYVVSRRARFFYAALQFILIAVGFILSFIGLQHLNYGSASEVRNLQMSLSILYTGVAINSLVALVYLLRYLHSFLALSKTSEQSVLRYFDTILESAMNSRFAQADDLEFFPFAYTMLGSEFSRNVQPEAVARNHMNMIRCMHAHKRGMESLEKYLDAKDAFVRLAAANMVGFWADRAWKVGVGSGAADELKLTQEVLTKLADKVSTTGQIGWAATASFGVLASSPEGARIVKRTRTSSGTGLPDDLAELVDASSSRSLSLVRTLGGFYEQLCVNEQKSPEAFGAEAKATLVQKLERLARGAKVHRLRVQAAYLLMLMGELAVGSKEEVVLGIEPGKDTYWFESEVEMLELLLRMSGHSDRLPLQLPTAADPQQPFLRKDAPISPPRWAADSSLEEP